MRLPEQGRLSLHGEVGGREAEAEAEGSVLCVPPLHCQWSTSSGPTLSGVGLEAGPAEMVVVVGAVGSGKTSLLLALLGELPAYASAEMGAADRLRPWEGAGRLAYAAQEAWVLSATLRENILLGAPLDEARYRAVLAAVRAASPPRRATPRSHMQLSVAALLVPPTPPLPCGSDMPRR